MLARGIPGRGRTCGVSFRPFLKSSGWWWLISSVFLIRISCHKTTHANSYYGAWKGWVVSISVLPLTKLLQLWQLPPTLTWVLGSETFNIRVRRASCLTNLVTTPLISLEAVMERERRPFSLGNIILLKEKGGMRESIPRQVDRESRSPQGERGL